MDKKVIAGYTYLRDNACLTDSDLKKLTHVNFAFGRIDGGDISFKDDEAYRLFGDFRRANPDIKLSLSLVGKTGADFPNCAATPESRKKIAESCARMVSDYGFDGVDLDWEYPCCPENFCDSSPADKENFTRLCSEVRNSLDRLPGVKPLLTIAAGADEYYTDSTEMHKVQEYLDIVYIMTYDFRCGFHSLSGHHTNLYSATGDIFRSSAHKAVGLFTAAGVPKEKICIGAAFYSRKLPGLPDRYNGFLQYSREHVVSAGPSYHELAEDYINKNGYTRYWDDECKAPYLWNPELGTFISYDDPESLSHKSAYVKDNGLAGLFYWNQFNDKSHTLLHSIQL